MEPALAGVSFLQKGAARGHPGGDHPDRRLRVSEEQFVQDEFQIMVKPKYYRHLNRRVSKLTGIKEARLRDEGVPFPEAIEKFREWCGEDVVFLTWGFDDIGILRENLRLFGLDERFTEKWYNAQMISMPRPTAPPPRKR